MTADFNKSIAASVILHLCVGLLLLVRVILAPSLPMELQRAIRVDVVDLPDKMMEPPAPAPEPTKAPAAPEPEKVLPTKVEPKPPEKPAVALKPQKDLSRRQKDALADLKRQSALDKIKGEVASQKAKENTDKVFKGNALSKGNSLTGLEGIAFNRYFDQMHSHLLQNWNLPQWLADANYKAQALVAIDENGHVIRKQLLKSSGNEVFDTNVLDAIDKSSPFPAPPDRIRGAVARGVIFNFPEQ